MSDDPAARLRAAQDAIDVARAALDALTAERDALIGEAHSSGLTAAQIAREIDVSRQAVHAILTRSRRAHHENA